LAQGDMTHFSTILPVCCWLQIHSQLQTRQQGPLPM